MEENISKALSYFSVAFFIITAISLFLMLYGKNSEMVNIVNKNISESGPVYQTNIKEQAGNKVSGAVIIGCIKNGLETDISINSVTVYKNVDINTFNFDMVDLMPYIRWNMYITLWENCIG